MRRITVNIGFITNSSSCVYHFPPEVLEDPEVKAFLDTYELRDGYVGHDLWSRSTCSSFLVTEEQKLAAKQELQSYGGYGDDEAPSAVSLAIDPTDKGVYVLYGDEYSDTTHILCNLLSRAYCRIVNPGGEPTWHAGFVTDYN